MIIWKDFILDDGLGPVLSPDLFSGMEKVRRDLRVTPSRNQEDARPGALIQETRRETGPVQAANTGSVRDLPWVDDTQVGAASNLENNAPYREDAGGGVAGARLRGAG